jgi:hypothetical protein
MTSWNTVRSRLAPALVTVGCVVVAATLVNVSQPDADVQLRRGVPGAAVSINEGTVTTASPQVCDTLLDKGQVTYRTAGMFVVVPVRVAATHAAQIRVDSFELTSGDQTYKPYGVDILIAAPGFATRTDVVFEVDPSRIDGLTLTMKRLETVSGYHQEVRVPLGFRAANADEWRARAQGSAADPETDGVTTVIS